MPLNEFSDPVTPTRPKQRQKLGERILLKNKFAPVRAVIALHPVRSILTSEHVQKRQSHASKIPISEIKPDFWTLFPI